MSEVSIRVIQFSGKSIDWPVWSEKCLARARRQKYRDILTGKTKVPDDKLDPDYSSILKLNEEAYEDIDNLSGACLNNCSYEEELFADYYYLILTLDE